MVGGGEAIPTSIGSYEFDSPISSHWKCSIKKELLIILSLRVPQAK